MYRLLLWALVFHILGVVFWMGGLLIAAHLLAADAEASSDETHQVLGRLEANLFRGIIHPGAAIVIISGAVMIATNPAFLHASWLHAKLALVAVLIGLDAITYRRMRAFKAGHFNLQRKQCMTLHGGIALAFILILVLVFIKPF